MSKHDMTSAERIDAVFSRKPTDLVPVCHIGIASGPASALLGREAFVGGGIQRWREALALWRGPDAHAEFLERSYKDAIAISRTLANDIIRPTYWRFNRKPTRRLDETTFLFEDGPEEDWLVLSYDPPTEQAAVMPYKPKAEADLVQLEKQIEAQEEAMEHASEPTVADEFARRAQGEFGDNYVIRTGCVGLGIPHNQVWMEALALKPDLVARHLDVAVQRAVRAIPVYVAAGFKYLFGGYDFASQEGPMFSPALFERLMTPRLRQITEACERHGARHLFASDGCLWPVAHGLLEKGIIHGYYEIDRSAGMDLRRLRDQFPHLTLLGNIASQTIHLGTVDQVREETLDCIQAAKELGGIIVGASNYFVPGTPIENMTTMLEIIRDYR